MQLLSLHSRSQVYAKLTQFGAVVQTLVAFQVFCAQQQKITASIYTISRGFRAPMPCSKPRKTKVLRLKRTRLLTLPIVN